MFKNKKVLVTGGAGMIGRELVNMLLEEQAIIHVADLKHPDDMLDQVVFHNVDLRDYASCLRLCDGMDYVFNLVGIKCSPRVAIHEPANIMGPMLQFNTNMLEAAMQKNVKWYLYTSTVGVYQPAEVLHEDDVWSTQPSKNDWYGGWAKRMGELQCHAYQKQYSEGKCSIVRPANVYGSYDNFDLDSAMVIPSLIRKAFTNDTLEVWGDGSAIRDFIHARDVARGMIFAVKNKITKPMNLGSGDEISIKRIAEIVVNKANIEIKWDITKPKGDPRRVLDMTRAASYGFFPEISIEEGISETIEWYLSNIELANAGKDVFKNLKESGL
jgi:GDP-L-fucose synthase